MRHIFYPSFLSWQKKYNKIRNAKEQKSKILMIINIYNFQKLTGDKDVLTTLVI
jgi:hypothetical protein